jgi:uncharacterized membrane protein YkvA (DUF1232 family)
MSAPELTKIARIGAAMGAHQAERYLRNPDDALRLLDAAGRKAERKGRGPLHAVWDGFQTLCRLIRAYVTRRYTRAPWATLLHAAGAVVYFVSPIDLIPDFIVGIGLVDDAAVIGWVLSAVGKDLREFREWEIEMRGVTTS